VAIGGLMFVRQSLYQVCPPNTKPATRQAGENALYAADSFRVFFGLPRRLSR
jgi:hypothetical protein